MKKKICMALPMLLAVICAFSISPKTQAAAKWLNVETAIKSKTQVSLSWKKHSVTGYEIYRAKVNNKGNAGKYQKIATVSGKKKTYTDKVSYKKHFGYRVKGYTLKGKKKVYQYQGETIVYTGMGQTCWGEYQQTDSEISPKAIPLTFSQQEGMAPTAYEIYRGTNNKTFKKLVTLKSKKMGGEYTDKAVTSGKTYYYKIRAYRTLSGKKYYGTYSDVIKLSAVRRVGDYTAEVLPIGEQEASAFILKLTSNEENGKTEFRKSWFQAVKYRYVNSESKQSIFLDMEAVEYSLDNVTWQALPKNGVVLSAGQTIYFKLETTDGSTFQPEALQTPRAAMVGIAILYNELDSYMTIDCAGKTATARVNLTRYH